MKTVISLLSVLISTTLCVSAASALPAKETSSEKKEKKAITVTDTTPSLEELLERSTAQEITVPPLRAELLSDISQTMGFRAGWVKRSLEIKIMTDQYTKQLDALFLFAPLVSRDSVLPPVIVEAKDVSSFSKDQIRTAHRVYSYAVPERFVSVPPTWQDYLYTGLATKETLVQVAHEVYPKDDNEKVIWERGIRKGWQDGEASADEIFDKNFNRLVRDFTGMIRYSKLMQTGMVTDTTIAESSEVVTGNDQEIIIGDTLKRIVAQSHFDMNTGKWKPIIAHSVEYHRD